MSPFLDLPSPHPTPRACYPARLFWNYETQALDRTLLEAEADRLGLTLEGSKVSRSDGTLRPVRKICSSAPEADCEAFLETCPYHALTLPHATAFTYPLPQSPPRLTETPLTPYRPPRPPTSFSNPFQPFPNRKPSKG